MHSRFLKTLAVVIGVWIITFVGFNQLYNNTAPSEHDILTANSRQAVIELTNRSEQADVIRTTFYIIFGVEIIGGVIALGIARI